ncbi:hypothetical protein BU26DRAFT_524632 [Trematosphaeria pertusa]|uniref:Uncharacterized protein n=1 Tax=Trematosphaeria pertusa TaxID=390896 RepID=A0A6A6HV76_9PLEO|nr:uncharacterized protein BU26DRAFT_524632 [Trematosphaeria pertusa]KAF2241996.1 hypothetical protein BU26DRAFT_524632 [Trematosphaeria pertusa]
MSNSTIARHYTRLLSLWPKDLLRPNLPFTRTIEYRGAPFGVKPLSAPDAKTDTIKAAPLANADPKLELANINALYSLLENRYSKAYPMSPGVLKPASNPEHYDRLMEEIERAPNKSWLSAKLDEWKSKIRWQ